MDVLLRVLEQRREAIKTRWVDSIRASSPKYADRPALEIEESVDAMLDGLVSAVSKGDYSHLFEFLNRVVALRSAMGFKISEVQRVVNVGTGTILEEVRAECGLDEMDACYEAFRRVMDVMYWASMSLGDTFEDIRNKEFTAGTLVTLAAAQEPVDQIDILRRSLDLAMSLTGCSHGAISMKHLGPCAVLVPDGDRRSEELFTRLGGRVVKEMGSVSLDRDGIAGLVPAEARRNEGALSCALGVPVRARGSVTGALMIGSVRHRPLSGHEVKLLEAVAGQIGLACDNARMFEEVRRREESLKRRHDDLLTMMNEIGGMVYVADMSTYEILAANRAITEVYGGGVVGKTCWKVLQQDQDGPCEFCTNKHLVKDGAPTGYYTWKFRNTRTGRWYRCSDRAVEWPDGRLARLEVAFDITDLEEAKEEVEDVKATLELYNDLLVHDIGNYATASKALIQLMADPETPEDKAEGMAKTALAQMDRIETLVERVSKLVKARTKGREGLKVRDLAGLLDEAIRDVAATPEGAETEFRREYAGKQYPAEAGDFAVDIFLNLIANGAKYGKGRPVTVSISEATVGDRPAWKVSVADEGAGVPPEKKGALFRRYERLPTLSQLKGMGLGLTIVRSLAEAYGGQVGLDDRVPGDHSKGAVFWVALAKGSPGDG